MNLFALASLYGFAMDDLQKNTESGNYNQIYVFRKGGEEFILRISPPNEDIAALERKMNYMLQHFRLGSPVIQPVPSRHGRLVEEILGDDGAKHAISVSKKAQGTTHEELAADTLDTSLFMGLGSNLAILHENSMALETQGLEFAHWYNTPNCFTVLDYGDVADQEIISRYQHYRDRCLQNPKTGENYGIIHGDLHFSNIVMDRRTGRVTFCDFDDVCQGFYAMDLALIILDLQVILQCPDKTGIMANSVERLLSGYNSRACHGQVPLPLIQDFTKLLEASLYIQYLGYVNENTDGWLRLFFGKHGERRRRIASDTPIQDAEWGM